jgi:hypothetical protein
MKPEMREKLAQLPFEEKIRKVGELIRLSRKIRAERVRHGVQNNPQSALRNWMETFPEAMYRVVVERSAEKDFRRLPLDVRSLLS